MIERLDLTNKQTWITTPTEELALYFGYQSEKNFKNALSYFLEEYVSKAEVTLYLATIAQKFFSDWQPPLKRLEKR